MPKAQNKHHIADQLARRLRPLAAAIGLIIVLVPPLIYFFINSRELRYTATYYAQDLSDQLEEFILESPTLWKYQLQKYLRVMHRFLPNKEITTIRIFDNSGEPITQYEYSVAELNRFWWNHYAQGGNALIEFNNQVLGTIHVRVSMRATLIYTFFYLMISSAIGVTLALLSYHYPVNVVERLEMQIHDLMQKLQFLSSKLIAVQEEERKKTAWEIHDNLATTLSAIKFDAQSALHDIQQDSAAAESLRSLISAIQLVIDESRRIMTGLYPYVLDDLGIVATIEWFCRDYQALYRSITIEARIEVGEGDVPDAVKGVIFRILQETLNNIARHSKAECVTLSLIKTDKIIELTVADDGTGFDLNQTPYSNPFLPGLGLISMNERAANSGGTFVIESLKDEGTMIRTSWPI
jgi:signal transduction histidine kinase